MDNEKALKILINDGCTPNGAKKHLELGTTIYTADNEAEMEETFGLTFAEIEAGNGGDIVATTYEGEKYYIAYAN